MKSERPILNIQDLRVEFLKPRSAPREVFSAVDGATIHVTEGSFTALVGESGSGKSVTALSVCRLVSAERVSGNIYFYPSDGEPKDLLRIPQSELLAIRGKEISYIFQDTGSSLNPLMKIGEQLDEVYRVHLNRASGEASRKSKELLNSVKIKDPERIYGSFPHELSGGMKQRVMMAMALIPGPQLLIADEPTTALDVMTEGEIMDLLIDLKDQRNLTILFITHNLSLAMAFSESIFVMQKGRVVDQLERAENDFNPTHPYTKKLFAARVHGLKPKSFIGV